MLMPPEKRVVRVVGVDCATQPGNIGVCLATYTQGVLQVVFAGADGELDSREWVNLETWRNLLHFRILITHGLIYGLSLLTQIIAQDY